jgi:hypothetical protein
LENPNPKIQTPNEIPTLQIPNQRFAAALEFGAYLDFGFWILGFRGIRLP